MLIGLVRGIIASCLTPSSKFAQIPGSFSAKMTRLSSVAHIMMGSITIPIMYRAPGDAPFVRADM